MMQNRKILGMTTTQIAILAGLAVVACVLLGVAGWLALRGGSNLLVPAPQDTAVFPATATPFMLPTLAPTSTITPTPPLPYESLIPEGWLQFKTALVEIWLPKQFKQGNLKSFIDPESTSTPELVMTGIASDSSLFQAYAMLSYEPLAMESLDAQLDADLTKMPPDVRMAERKKVTVNSSEAVRFVFETRHDNVDVTQLTYVFLDGTTIWFVEYAAQIKDFYDLLPTFEQSVKTFRVVR